jgi:hypothetical protein
MMRQISSVSLIADARVKTDGVLKAAVSERDAPRILLFALVSIAPVFLLFQFVGRPISWGLDSTHAVLCQLGYALSLGYFFCRIWDGWSSSPSLRRSDWLPAILMGIFAGIGVFFSNLNIDQYRASWQSQSRFLTELLRRFPSLPQGAYLIADVRGKDLYSDIHYYDIEFPINLLYARSTLKKEFYKHRIITADDFQPFALVPTEAQHSGKFRIDLASDYGIQTVDINKFIFIYYRDGELLVNQEIAAQFPNISYKSWLDRTLPEQDQITSIFPLRERLGFSPRMDR